MFSLSLGEENLYTGFKTSEIFMMFLFLSFLFHSVLFFSSFLGGTREGVVGNKFHHK
jgi:hypothetical protein